jgi:hypothetical protein
MTWVYEIETGKLTDPSGKVVTQGYAGGNCGKNPEGKNNPGMCGVKSIGPLPPGTYTFGVPVEHSKLGPFAIPLNPAPTNDMMGRGSFYMHGDTTPSGNASEGCIIMPRAVRVACAESSDCRLQVVIRRTE